MPQQEFKGYSDDQKKRIASKLGHTGDMASFDSYLQSNPAAKAKFFKFKTATEQRYAKGGAVNKAGFREGGLSDGISKAAYTSNPYSDFFPDTEKPPAMQTADIAFYTDPFTGEEKQGSSTHINWINSMAEKYGGGGSIKRGPPPLIAPKPNKPTREMKGSYMPENKIHKGNANQTALEQTAIERSLDPGIPEQAQTKAFSTGYESNQDVDSSSGQVTGYDPSASITNASTSTAAVGQDGVYKDISTDTSASAVKGVTDGVSGATGQLTDTVQAQQGTVTKEAKAETGTAGTVEDTDKLKFSAGQKVIAATGESATSEAQTSGKTFAATGTTFDSDTPEARAAEAYELERAKSAEMGEYKVMDPAKAGTIPTADVVQSDAKSGVAAQTRFISNKELVDVSDLQLDEPVAAVAETMNALNKEAKMIAQKGTFSQELATDRQGAVTAASTMAGQMESLMAQFNDGTPAWAAGALRNANAAMASRGIGASSMAGAALVQAAMESAMPIAQNDAAVFANMGIANLNNRQQTSLSNAAAQQNLSLTNLSNEQQSALQNSTNAFSLQTESLSNLQSVVLSNQQVKAAAKGMNLTAKTQTSLANAAKYAEVNNINLSNAQQSNLAKSAENLTVDMSNLSNAQSTALSNLQVRASIKGQELTNDQQMAMIETTQSFEAASFDATTQQAAFMQDAAADAAMKGQVLSNQQQVSLFNVSSQLSERELELSSEQQTKLYNTTNAMQMDVTNLSNKQQTALANAQIDASIKGQELSNKQQTNVLNASRISEIANMNFTAEQSKAIQNSNLAQTMDLANLSNKQATQLANAATTANMDMANLNNRQQAEVQNAQSFLDVDMANLNNEQQATMFKAQSRISSIMSDKGAANATKQFNASSSIQVDQFYDNMATTMSQFNATQKNAQAQFNAGEANAVAKFNAEVQNNRDQFNATNRMAVDQSNATWRREIATTDTAALNRANEINARAALDISNSAYNDLWQEHRDEMDWVYEIAEGDADRMNELARAVISAEASKAVAGKKLDAATSTSIGNFLTKWIFDKS